MNERSFLFYTLRKWFVKRDFALILKVHGRVKVNHQVCVFFG